MTDELKFQNSHIRPKACILLVGLSSLFLTHVATWALFGKARLNLSSFEAVYRHESEAPPDITGKSVCFEVGADFLQEHRPDLEQILYEYTGAGEVFLVSSNHLVLTAPTETRNGSECMKIMLQELVNTPALGVSMFWFYTNDLNAYRIFSLPLFGTWITITVERRWM